MNGPTGTTRRDFLKQTLASGAALSLPIGVSNLAHAADAATSAGTATMGSGRHPVTREHPRLFGSLEELRALAHRRSTEFKRVSAVARAEKADTYSWIISAGLVAAIEGDTALAAKVQEHAMKLVNGPIRVGHLPFGTDLALCGIAFDLGASAWSDVDRLKLIEYVNKTVDANVNSETHVFHNAWYGYKNWGIGLAAYALYYENERAPAMLRTLEEDYRTRAAPALELAGEGGGWAEGYYVHYWLYEWLVFCEVARRCEGVDYYAAAPKFYRERALASAFETYPGIGESGSRRCVPMGDGGGRLFGGDRDKTLSARRILVSRFREDSLHQAVHAFNELTPRSSVGDYAYKDFLWHDASLPHAEIKSLPLSHLSRGPGFVYGRSSWAEDATYFFFKCGDRFTAHQHLDVNHFLIYKHAELAGDGGHYDEFGTTHDVNYHLRTIAHSTVLVLDPEEQWPAIRGGQVTANDGGQHHSWKHHNGALADPADWLAQKSQCDIGDILAFEDRGDYLYVAGDATRAYAPHKLERFTRQILYLRPNTFVIFDQVHCKQPQFKKTWLLQAMRPPEKTGQHLVITNGQGRLFLQSLLPEQPEIRSIVGESLYQVNGRQYLPKRDTGPATECRIEISPSSAATSDLFLHVLTAADDQTTAVPTAHLELQSAQVRLTLGSAEVVFRTEGVGGEVLLNGHRQRLTKQV